jgi:hypothetical protein
MAAAARQKRDRYAQAHIWLTPLGVKLTPILTKTNPELADYQFKLPAD